jgi:regulator of sirC expression with transglutaminase-like and TPR domain
MPTPSIEALISLLDDPDQQIFQQVKEELIKLGPLAIKPLEHAWETSNNQTFQERIENLIHQIQFNLVKTNLLEWINSPDHDLLTGAIIVAQYQYPDLDKNKIENTLEQIKRDIWIELNDRLTALEKVKIINHILYDIYGFSGNVEHYHSPQNSYINIVLEKKKGNPLSLSIIYIILAQKLNIPIYGVNLPEHFIICYLDAYNQQLESTPLNQIPILFYINTFSKGVVFTKRDIDSFLKQLNIEPRPQFYLPCNNIDIVKRLIRNLALAFEKENELDKKQEMLSLLELLEQKSK